MISEVKVRSGEVIYEEVKRKGRAMVPGSGSSRNGNNSPSRHVCNSCSRTTRAYICRRYKEISEVKVQDAEVIYEEVKMQREIDGTWE